MDPSGGGDGTSEGSKDGKSKEAPSSEKVVQAALLASPSKGDLASPKGVSAAAEEEDISKRISTASDEEDRPLYPDVFHGFEELPESQGVALLDGYRSDNCEDLLRAINENTLKTNNLKRNLGYESENQLDSPKRYRYSSKENALAAEDMNLFPEELDDVANKAFTEDELSLMLYGFDSFAAHEVETADENDHSITRLENLKRVMSAIKGDVQEEDSADMSSETAVIAHSPVERFRLANALRRLVQSNYKKGATLDKRGATMDKREATMDKREATMDKREASVERREANLERREVRAENKANIENDKSEDDPAKNSSIADTIEKGKVIVEKAGSYGSLADNIINFPTKSKDMVKSYKDNKAIAQEYIMNKNKVFSKKLKGYVGSITTVGVLNAAKDALVGSLQEMLGGEAAEADGSASEGEAGVSASKVETAGSLSEPEAEAACSVSEPEVKAAGSVSEPVPGAK